MVKVIWTDFALEFLVAIGDFIENDSYIYAQRVVNQLFTSVYILEYYPYSGRVVPELNDKTPFHSNL
jgi:plasmid stabilization system protein ParE